jgi:hypothetical protein
MIIFNPKYNHAKRGSVLEHFNGDTNLKINLPLDRNAMDVTNYANHGTFGSTTSIGNISGTIKGWGPSANFPRTNLSQVALVNQASWVYLNTFSIMMWLNPLTWDNAAVIWAQSDATTNHAIALILAVSGGAKYIQCYSYIHDSSPVGRTVNIPLLAPLGVPFHIAAVFPYVGSGVTYPILYVNGVCSKSATQIYSPPSTDRGTLGNWRGDTSTNYMYKGNMWEFAFFNRELSAQEVADYYYRSINTRSRIYFPFPSAATGRPWINRGDLTVGNKAGFIGGNL